MAKLQISFGDDIREADQYLSPGSSPLGKDGALNSSFPRTLPNVYPRSGSILEPRVFTPGKTAPSIFPFPEGD